MKKIASFLTIAALSLVISCASGDEKAMEAPKPTPVTGKGVVTVVKTGGFEITAENGKKYTVSNPDKLDKKFQKDKAKVEFAGNELGDTLELTSVK